MNTPRQGKRETAVIAAPFGSLALEAEDGLLVGIELKAGRDGLAAPSSPLLAEAARQFEAYFEDPKSPFSLRLPVVGTEHQRRVWQAMSAIPPGSARSYGAIAAELRSSPRAVAGACRANHFPIAIPCHRVVAAHGLGGYCGAVEGPFIDIKRWLLRHEGYESA